jgi:methionyl-tRNA synthetase
MADKILVAVAWPYANGPLHVGHVAGAYLPADIFARYQRLRGNDVLMVSDCHGTPITLQAMREGVPPQEVIRRYHASFIETFSSLGISFDLFTQTYTANHYALTKAFFLRLLNNGYLHKETALASYSESLHRFLPDRFVEGNCPNCSYTRARGDQCDKCGKLHDPSQLGDPHSTLDGGRVIFRQTEHFVLDLHKLEPYLREWLDSHDRGYWRANTLQFTSNWLQEGLHDRAITRDLEWGVPVPVDSDDFKDKRIYVWFDAVIGYLSATVEWAERTGDPERWRKWWENHDSRSYYFIGKDNIPFHTIIWPAMLIGFGGLMLPYDIPWDSQPHQGERPGNPPCLSRPGRRRRGFTSCVTNIRRRPVAQFRPRHVAEKAPSRVAR